MGSLSTRAGITNPNSFSIDNVDRSYVRYRRYNDEVKDTDLSSWLVANRDRNHEVFIGRNLENFHRRKNNGELLPYTQYLCIKHDISISGPSEINYGFDNYGSARRYNFTWTDGSQRPVNFTPITFSAVYNNRCQALLEDAGINLWSFPQQAAAKLYSRGWDGLTFLAEFHQIVRMFRGCVNQFIDLVRQYLGYKRSILSSDTALKTFNEWLQGRYGWRILLYDIEDINKLIDDIDKEQRTRTKERVGNSYTFTVDDSFTKTIGLSYPVSDITTWNVSVRGSIIADFMPNRINLNPVVTAWELVPYSFVVDWFFSIGRALEALSFLAVNNAYTASYGYHAEIRREVGIGTVTFPPSWPSPWQSGLDEYSVTQTVDLKFRQPTVVSAIPSVRINLDWLKVTDLVALIGQFLLRLS